MTRLRLILALCLWLAPLPAAAGEALPRILAGLYDSRESQPRMSFTHRFLEMPANHLGFDIHYYDINEPLPVLGDEVYGAVIWLSAGNSVPDADPYLDWLEREVVAKKKQLVIVENAGIAGKHRERDGVMERYNRVLSHIGIQDFNQWHSITYRTKPLFIDKSVASFERPIGPVLPAFGYTQAIPGKAVSYVKMSVPGQEQDSIADLITTSPHGGYIAEGYAIFHVVENDESRIIQWFVNPFEFLRRSLNMGISPIPDVTTLNGRRIFYSHIDGDGWNNLCEIPAYSKRKTLSAEVVKDDIIKAYPDFPVTVAPIISDLDTNCYGLKDSERLAREIFALPNVEPASHTHSHPLYWRYFANYTPEKEEPLLNRYPEKPKNKSSLVADLSSRASMQDWKGMVDGEAYHNHRTLDMAPKLGRNEEDDEQLFTKREHDQYETPRSFACTPFLLDQEIAGSIDYVNRLTPPGKKARLIQWSGDTSPYEEALRKTREAGLLNINGGDSRFDREYPSYSSVAPIGLKVGNERQIYSSNSNENTYTNLWTGRFFGFRYLQTTVRNTESPIRVRPFNIYFHIYSGQKLASLNAVRENFDFARSQTVIPITTSEYTQIANSFYGVRLEPAGEKSWKIKNRGTLQTLRFDHALGFAVDFEASEGILGQNYLHDSLYVSLNPATEEPIITLKENKNAGVLPPASLPYMVNSRWAIKDLQPSKSLLTIHTQGYGPGEMQWMMPKSGNYLVKAKSIHHSGAPVFEKKVQTNNQGLLDFVIDTVSPEQGTVVTIETMEP